MDKNNLISFLKLSKDKPFHVEGDVWFVPCIANLTENSFRPLLKPLDSSLSTNEYSRKKLWSELEDETLRSLVGSRGPKGWSVIAKEINSLIHNSLKIRQGRQCRERWFNHVDPELNKGDWTVEEDEMLCQAQSRLGNKWSEIAKLIRGRNENSVKNRWKSRFKCKGFKDGLRSESFSTQNDDEFRFDESPRFEELFDDVGKETKGGSEYEKLEESSELAFLLVH